MNLSRQVTFRTQDNVTPANLNRELDNIVNTWNAVNNGSSSLAFMVGSVQMYAGTAVPAGWLSCDGSAVSRTTYADLFTAISTTWGTGDGSTTFNLPDFRGVFPKGAGTTNRSAGKDASGNFYAGTLGTYSQDQLQGHYHNDLFSSQYTVNGGGGGNITNGTPNGSTNQLVLAPKTDGTNGTPRTGHTTEPQSAGITFMIKY